MKAIIKNQLVDVEILETKKGLFGKKYRVLYKVALYNGDGKYLYTEDRVKWVRKIFNS